MLGRVGSFAKVVATLPCSLYASRNQPIRISFRNSSWIRNCSWVTAAFCVLYCGALSSSASAQWPARTLRDTLIVPANRAVTTPAKIAPGTSVQMQVDYYGTFSAFANQDSQAIDAAYTYRVPNWSAPFPLPNPPGYGSTRASVYLEATYNIAPVKAKFVETSAQSTTHHYTWREWGTGARWQYRVYNRLDERPDGYYYAQSKGSLKIILTQFTAGVAIKSKFVDFGSTNIGFPNTLIDSIQSYGIDPLRIDSIWIDGPDATAFSYVSERGDAFSLPNESTNDFHIKFSPQRTGYHDAVLHVHAGNADAPGRYVNITLRGLGASPSLAVGPKTLDFSKVRVPGTGIQRFVTLFNGGNADLRITNITLTPAPGTPANTFTYSATIPLTVYKGNTLPLAINFRPAARQSYRAVLRFTGLGVADDSVVLLGEGGMPDLTLKDATLQFDTVYTGDFAVRTTRVTNNGNWTAKIVSAPLSGGSMSAFRCEPDDSKGFLLNAGESRDYKITFQPSTNTDGPHIAYLTFNFDDGAPSKIVQLNGYELKRRLAYDTRYLDFGKVKVNQSGIRAVHIVNSRPIVAPVFTSWSLPAGNPFSVAKAVSSVQPGVDSIQFTFAPTSRGSFSNWALFVSNGQRDSVMTVGIGAQPMAKFNPPALDIGTVVSGQSGSGRTTLSDTGDFPLYVIGVKVSGADANDFSPYYGYKTTDTVRDGGIDSRFIGVTFRTNERTGRVHHAFVQVIYDDSTTDSFPVQATEASGHVTFGSRAIDFGKVRLGRQDQQPVRFVNPMEIALNVGKIWLDPASAPLALSQSSTTVDPMNSATVNLTFAPTIRGTYTAHVHASEGDMLHDSILVTGIGAQSVAKLSTDRVDFGSVVLRTSSAPIVVSLSNIGDWTLAGTVIKLKDPYNEFAVSGPTGTIDPTGKDTVLEAGTHTYSITFTPKRPNLPDHRGELFFTFDDGTTQTVTLVGRDVSNYLGVDSSVVDFGKVRVGAIAQHPVHLINTSTTKLTADQLQIYVPTAPFAANPNRLIDVAPNTSAQIDVRFAPQIMGAVQAILVGQGSAFDNQAADTVLLQGIGAMPIPQLGMNQLDFGGLVVGTSGTQSTTLTNAGNWPLSTNMKLSGPNANDFTVHFATDTVIAEGESTNIVVDFLATTPIQTTPRTATITFTQDDGTTFALALLENDREPLPSQIGFGNYIGRPGDKITVYLRLRSTIPANLNVQSLKGSVQFDPAIATLLDIQPASLAPAPFWTSTITNQTANGFDYDLTSTSQSLTGPGALYALTFQIRTDVQPGGRSALVNTSNFPATREVAAVPISGVILVDSSCGSTHVSAGEARATFVLQNTPNPFGSDKLETSIPFDIEENGATITLQIFDQTGHEVLRPVDHVHYTQGHYSATVEAQQLGSGAFYYEFSGEGKKPEIKKMIVQ
jgi:hypothetical protein